MSDSKNKLLFALPDFRNIGIIVRIMMLSIMMMMLLPLLSESLYKEGYLYQFFSYAIWMSPATLILIIVLGLSNHLLRYLPVPALIVSVFTACLFGACEFFFSGDAKNIFAHGLILFLFSLFLTHYYALRCKALSPALSEARLSALTARIRPHFLFNSLNAAMSLVYTRPEAAEMVLENLADLFRAQLKADGQESTLGREIELARGYIDIEQIRMGKERLRVVWNISAPDDAITPQLLLQPLLENSIYHGIEPIHRPGKIEVGIVRKGNWIYIRIENPLPDKENCHKDGNKMAMKNLKERLKLMYDSDATLQSRIFEDKFCVDIRIPYYVLSVNRKKQ